MAESLATKTNMWSIKNMKVWRNQLCREVREGGQVCLDETAGL